MKRFLAILCVAMLVTASIADAANRKGSHRVYNSKGKGSHYIGGHK